MATDSIDIVTIKDTLKTTLEAISWQPSENSKVTSFANVYLAKKFGNPKQGSPFLCIIDAPIDLSNKGLKASFYGKNVPFDFYVCADYANLDEEEAERRVVHAYQALESWLVNATNLETAGFPSYEYMGWRPFRTQDLSIQGRILTLRSTVKILPSS